MDNYLEKIRNGWNETSDSDWYQSLRAEDKIKRILECPDTAFHPTIYQTIKKYLPDLSGKRVLLPSSGDNHAAFAFAALGANVTSSDISDRQLEHARSISEKHHLNITFIRNDTMRLSQMGDNEFDLVYTSNGTHVWINELSLMYENIYRVLKQGGISLMYDIHPFNRPFVGDVGEPKVKKSYNDIAPYLHWRVQDLINATAQSRLIIKEMAEMQAVDGSFWYRYEELAAKNEEQLSEVNDWKVNPMAALPAWVSIVAQK